MKYILNILLAIFCFSCSAIEGGTVKEVNSKFIDLDSSLGIGNSEYRKTINLSKGETAYFFGRGVFSPWAGFDGQGSGYIEPCSKPNNRVNKQLEALDKKNRKDLFDKERKQTIQGYYGWRIYFSFNNLYGKFNNIESLYKPSNRFLIFNDKKPISSIKLNNLQEKCLIYLVKVNQIEPHLAVKSVGGVEVQNIY